MIEKVSLSDFCQRFKDYGRQDHFSYEGLEALFNYYEELEEDMKEQIELDVIGICCDWTEFESIANALKAYNKTFRDLSEQTEVLELDNFRVLVRDF